VYLFPRAGTEAWVGRRALMAIVPSALLVAWPDPGGVALRDRRDQPLV